MQNSECSDYMTEEEHERLENARKELEKVPLELERKPTMLWRLFRETALLDAHLTEYKIWFLRLKTARGRASASTRVTVRIRKRILIIS
jgi:hypothetical protein